MSINKEFPDYDDKDGFADLLAKLPGFHDSSWHNDTCPSMHHEGTNTRIWVEYADPEKRENPGKRFVIERGDAGDTETILETDLGSDVIDWYHNRKVVTCRKRHLVDSTEAQQVIQNQLNAGGWDDVFPGDDGSYDECFSVVDTVSPQKD